MLSAPTSCLFGTSSDSCSNRWSPCTCHHSQGAERRSACRSNDASIAELAKSRAKQQRIQAVASEMNCTEVDPASIVSRGRRKARDSMQSVSQIKVSTWIVNMFLTPRAYVCEQYMSPRKKSLNSTGKTPASSNRHCDTLAEGQASKDNHTYIRPNEPKTAPMI